MTRHLQALILDELRGLMALRRAARDGVNVVDATRRSLARLEALDAERRAR